MLVVSQSPLSALNCRLDELWAGDEDLTPTGDGQPVVEDGPSGRGVHEERGWKSWYRRTAVLHDYWNWTKYQTWTEKKAKQKETQVSK